MLELCYIYIYLALITTLSVFTGRKYLHYTNDRLTAPAPAGSSQRLYALILCAVLIFFIGLRPLGVGGDMFLYNQWYESWYGATYRLCSNKENFIFNNILRIMSCAGIPVKIFFLFISAIYFGAMFLACRKLFPKDTLFSFLIYLGAFSTFAYAANGMRGGAAASLVLLGIAYHDKLWICILLLFSGLAFHHSMLLPVCSFIVCYFFHKPVWFIAGWGLSLMISTLHVNIFNHLFASLPFNQLKGYLTNNELVTSHYYTGFRLDFILYSSSAVILGYWTILKGYKSKFFNILYCTYLLANSLWMLCMYANYTNRIAYLSWILLPIVIIYPFFDKPFVNEQYKKAVIVAGAHLGFTLFMQLIYYGFLKSMLNL